MDIDSLDCARYPKIGDHWTEMFNWDLIVIDVSDGKILSMEGIRSDKQKLCKRTLTDFQSFLSYKKIPGLWAVCVRRNVDVSSMIQTDTNIAS